MSCPLQTHALCEATVAVDSTSQQPRLIAEQQRRLTLVMDADLGGRVCRVSPQERQFGWPPLTSRVWPSLNVFTTKTVFPPKNKSRNSRLRPNFTHVKLCVNHGGRGRLVIQLGPVGVGKFSWVDSSDSSWQRIDSLPGHSGPMTTSVVLSQCRSFFLEQQCKTRPVQAITPDLTTPRPVAMDRYVGDTTKNGKNQTTKTRTLSTPADPGQVTLRTPSTSTKIMLSQAA